MWVGADASINELRNFPIGDPAGPMPPDSRVSTQHDSSRQHRRVTNPPDPDMGIEDDH
ncbi:MAG: hypothetical protein AVDCRST_MAG26-726 [uncultured Chloroflexia bacterium]|uniref:Uncharacterized protein n=1 Tax=uncultured Chloroflexia bacterium TaxID=1672391 RepID=A0A6J4HJY6_9CHLR|nr:MAG: hypothetical protein AVDCRST_MAG26-726 [uncultured Chloroflexia bacterium]